jgi:hypothetical protein
VNGRLARAFQATAYQVGSIAIRPGRRCPGAVALLRRMGAREGAFVTACNPMARRQAPGWNAVAQRRLREAAGRWPMLPALSQPLRALHAGWAEDQWFVAAPPRCVARLGRRFRQRAILAVGRDGVARLIWI